MSVIVTVVKVPTIVSVAAPGPQGARGVAGESAAESQAKVDAHNTSGTAHADIRALITAAVAGVPEQARDALGAALVAGANITITPNDGADTITISASVGTPYTDELAQDAIAALLAAGTHAGISFVYDDAGNAISATVAAPSWASVTSKPTFAAVATSGSAADLTTGILDDARIPSGIARDSEVSAAVAALVNSAPGTLDTLGEIATALQADESTAAALATTVGGKLAKASNLSDLTNAGTARTNLGLGSVDNVADSAKPVSTATQTALDAKAADLPESASSARATADGTPNNLLNKATRYDTTGGAINQILPAATAGRVFAIGWDAGTAALTLTAAGSDVIGSGAVTSFAVPLAGEVLTYHCTTAGRWRVVSGFKPQSSLDDRYQRISPSALVSNRQAFTILAHRGGGSVQGGYYQGPHPEETFEAYAACVAGGVIWLESDCNFLSDAALALMHDTTPDRTTDATGSVNLTDYTAAAFKRLKVDPQTVAEWPGYGVNWGELHPPLLGEYLDRFGGSAVHVVEAKARGNFASGTLGTAISNMFVARGLGPTAIVQSFAPAELTGPAAAGIETMYLAPDLGTAGSDVTSIQSAMTSASGWSSGKPKHVGIYFTPAGQTQAQVVTYIGTLVAAGMTVWAYAVARRYDRDWLQGAGVAGIFADEPIYLNTSSKVNKGSVDPLSLGVWPHGVLHADQSRGRGSLTNGGMKLDYVASSGAQNCCYGALSPPSSLTAYTIQADFVWDQLDTDTTRYAEIVLGCPDDRATSWVNGSGNGFVDSYQVIFRQSAASVVVSKAAQGGSSSTGLLTQTTGLPPAPTAGTVTTFKIQVTATQLIISLIQGGTTYGPWTVTDSAYRGGYLHLGKNMSTNATKLIGTWKNVSVT